MDEKLNNHKFSFEKLEVWQNSLDFAKLIYEVTDKFPKTEIYGLSSQIRRATVSISSNIAEGSTRSSLKDQARYTEIAFGSLLETLNQLIIANKIGYIGENELYMLRDEIEKISRQLNALKKSQIKRQKIGESL